MIKDEDRLLSRAKNSNKLFDWGIVRNSRNTTNFQILHAKANYMKDNLNLHQNNSKRFWQNIKEILPTMKDIEF